MQGSPLANGTETQADTDWTSIDWHQAERRVRNLSHRIFRATQAERLENSPLAPKAHATQLRESTR